MVNKGTICDYWRCEKLITKGEKVYYEKGYHSYEAFCSRECLKADKIDDLDIRTYTEGEK